MEGSSLESPTPPLLLLPCPPLRLLLPRPPCSLKPPNPHHGTTRGRVRERGAGRMMADGAAARPAKGGTTVASSGRHGEVETERNPNMGSTQFAHLTHLTGPLAWNRGVKIAY
uniref:Uncharacterized protein n=1 Tax=Opuntia streptacantha TaxID=393608 RepID=A0A7C9EW02_OPUST